MLYEYDRWVYGMVRCFCGKGTNMGMGMGLPLRDLSFVLWFITRK